MLLQGKEKDLSADGVDYLGLVEALPIFHDMLDDVIAILVLRKSDREGD